MKCPSCGVKYGSIWKMSYGKEHQCKSCGEKFSLSVNFKRGLILVLPLFILNFFILKPLVEYSGYPSFPIELVSYLILALSIVSAKRITNAS